MYKPLFNIICCIFPLLLFGQEYDYVHYDTKDGLAGSTVYNIIQDRDGFMWFATEYGVSRFDGKSFKNFTTDNGLTDNEVLKIAADKKGRVWFFPYNKTFCYWENNKIYNAGEVYKLDIQHKISLYGESQTGDLYIICNNKLFLLKSKGEKKQIADIGQLISTYKLENDCEITFKRRYKDGKEIIDFLIGSKVFVLTENGLILENKTIPTGIVSYRKNGDLFFINNNSEWVQVKNYKTEVKSFDLRKGANSYIVSTSNGCYLMDSVGYFDLKHPFLLNKNISISFEDTEHNLWFATLGDGVYKLSSTSIKSYTKNGEVMSLSPMNDLVQAGTSSGKLVTIKNGSLEKEYNFNQFNSLGQDRRLFCIKNDKENNLFLGFDSYFLKLKNNKVIYDALRPIKSIDVFDDEHLIVSTNKNVLKINKSTLSITDTLLKERGTKVICDNGKVYIGTLKGVKLIDLNRKVSDLSDQAPILKRRITDMVKAKDGSLWITTNDTGVLHLNINGKVDVQITTANQLSSNLCKSLCLDNNILWVGTNKGMNKIDISKSSFPIIKYSTSDGLPSDIINVIYAKDSIVYVGSPAGLTYFNENSISHTSLCNFVLENISVSEKHIDSFNNIHLGYKDNNISFNYTAISIKSAGDIIYKYKLFPLDDGWKETRLNVLSYPTLPSGKYQLQIYAINKYGKSSKKVFVYFDIATPFWKTIWFWLLVFVFSISVVGFFIRRRYLMIQESNNEKARIKQQLAILEQNALQAQMNPHFIFNCLNSIQQFIMLNDKEKANRYLTEFANLIRNTFDNSGKKNITVAEEAGYLDKYLDLEQLRYGDNFKYEINIDKSVEKDFTEMPAMLLQPYVENSLRHGIRNKREGGGIVVVDFKQQNGILICTVTDNGVGRDAALFLKSQEHIEYQSKGMLLTARRIELLNTGLENNITVEVKDLKDEGGNPSGTEIVIQIPLT